MKSKKPPLMIFLLLLVVGVHAQTPRQRGTARRSAPRSVAAQPTPEPSALPASPALPGQPETPIPIVTVNGQTITTADIDQSVRGEVDKLSGKIAAAPKQVLELQINTILLEVEAKKRHTTSQQLYDAEVTKRITEPTTAEISAFIAQNRTQLDQTDDLNARVTAYMRADREAKLSDDLVRRLRTTNSIVAGVDINTANLSPNAVLATVAGQPITAGSLGERLKPVIYKMRASAYEMQKEAAEQTIDNILLLAEANRRNIGPEEIVRAEVSQKVHTPTEAEVSKFFSENRERIKGDLDAVRNQLAIYLQEEDQHRLQRAMSERLRKGVDIRWLISAPVPPIQLVSTDDDPSRGAPNTPATVVEFTDFQCPACAAMHPVLEEVLKSYGDKVRFVVRDFPLNIHANARKAAEAANAANAQGKFFEYTALLFKRQNALDVPSLKKYASDLGLDRVRFDAALDGGTYAAEVKHDIDDGEFYGVDSTPAIFVNGIALREMSIGALRALIDRGLAGANSSSKVSAK